jgi:homoserine dehydrogenase
VRGKKSIGIGMMGLGVVGGGVAQALLEKERAWAGEIGRPLVLRKVLVRNLAKPRPLAVDPHLLAYTGGCRPHAQQFH